MPLKKLASQSATPSPRRVRDTSASSPKVAAESGGASSGPGDGVALSGALPETHRRLTPASKSGSQISQATLPSALQPESDRIYLANRGQPRPIQLSFDDAAVAFVKGAGLQVDLENALLLTQDGRTVPLDARVPSGSDPSHSYAVASGKKLSATAEPWQFRVPGTPGGIFGKPHGVRLMGGDNGLGLEFLDPDGKIIDRSSPSSELDDFRGFRVDTKVFRHNRSATLGRVASHVPSPLGLIGPASLPFQDTEFKNVTLRAPSQESLGIVKDAFGKLLGPISTERSEKVDLAELDVFEQQFHKLLSQELEAGGDIDGLAIMQKTLDVPLARRAMEELCGAGSETMGNAELLQAASEKTQRACPLEIVVIPRDKTAADCVESTSEEEKQQLSKVGRAWFQTTDPLVYRAQTGAQHLPVQRLFVGEEILASEQGVKAVLMHELLHIFEQRYANPEETEQIDRSFGDAQEFQSLYGSNRDEYLTTVSEEFLSAHGADGPAWVKEQHPRIFDLLSKLTGMSPKI